MVHILQIAKSTAGIPRPALAVQTYSPGVTVHTLSYSINSGNEAYPDTHFLKTCLAYCKKHGISSVISGNDLGSLIAALTNQELGLPGASVESVFLTLHKQITKKITKTPIKSKLWNIWTDFPKLTFPLYVKAPYSSFGTLGFEVKSVADIERITPQLQSQLPAMNKPFYELLSPTEITKKYPSALQDVVTIEPLIHAPQVTVEGYVHQGRVVPLCITDTNFFPGNALFDNFSLPSRQSSTVQQAIFDQTIKDISATKLNTSFFNAEYWIIDDKPLLIEINCRAAYCFRDLYKDVYDYDLKLAMLQLAQGIEPVTLLPARAAAAQFNVFDFHSHSYQQLVALRKIIPNLSIRIVPTTAKKARSDHGVLVAQFELTGSGYEEIFAMAEKIRTSLQHKKRVTSLQKNVIASSQIEALAFE